MTEEITDPNPINDPVVKREKLLRTDGPTLAEYVADGYDERTYPPYGYAARTDSTLDKAAPVVKSNVGKTDELSVAARKKQYDPLPPTPPVETPYHLDYDYNGEHITENHSTVRQALAGVRRLKQLGIVPATSTDS